MSETPGPEQPTTNQSLTKPESIPPVAPMHDKPSLIELISDDAILTKKGDVIEHGIELFDNDVVFDKKTGEVIDNPVQVIQSPSPAPEKVTLTTVDKDGKVVGSSTFKQE